MLPALSELQCNGLPFIHWHLCLVAVEGTASSLNVLKWWSPNNPDYEHLSRISLLHLEERQSGLGQMGHNYSSPRNNKFSLGLISINGTGFHEWRYWHLSARFCAWKWGNIYNFPQPENVKSTSALLYFHSVFIVRNKPMKNSTRACKYPFWVKRDLLWLILL